MLVVGSKSSMFSRAVGRTYQAVDTHKSSHFYEIEQKERPVECALCSVKDGIHAMYPLFDFHGRGGRRICVSEKTKSKGGSTGEKELVWAHALCALYLASMGLMYSCYKDGDYVGMEDEEDDLDPRPPNPELKVTREFKRMYGDSPHHFRYYMTPPNGDLDQWTKAVVENKRDLKCIECGLMDDKKSMRIPVQCVANDPDEFMEHKKKHMERNNDVEPCTQALHVGCARWGDLSSTLRKCYFFPGTTDQDGSIAGGIDTVRCIYCTKHAENVDENHQKIVKRDSTLLEKKRAAERSRLGKRPQIMQQAMNLSKDRLGHKVKNINKRSAASMSVNSGEQPALAERRRKIANEESTLAKEDVNKIFGDLVSHQDEIARNRTSVINGRKRYWKNEFSGHSPTDFDTIWIKARTRFERRIGNLDISKISTSSDDEPADVSSLSVRDTEEEKMNTNTKVAISEDKNVEPENDRRYSGDIVTDINFNASKNNEIERSEGALKEQKSRKKSNIRKRVEHPPDRWSTLFIGQAFEMGNEFTLDKFRKIN